MTTQPTTVSRTLESRCAEQRGIPVARIDVVCRGQSCVRGVKERCVKMRYKNVIALALPNTLKDESESAFFGVRLCATPLRGTSEAAAERCRRPATRTRIAGGVIRNRKQTWTSMAARSRNFEY